MGWLRCDGVGGRGLKKWTMIDYDRWRVTPRKVQIIELVRWCDTLLLIGTHELCQHTKHAVNKPFSRVFRSIFNKINIQEVDLWNRESTILT